MSKGYQKTETFNQDSIDQLKKHYEQVLVELGEDPDREGLKKTPERVAKAMQFLTHGYELDPAEILRGAMFHEDYSQMVLVKDIELVWWVGGVPDAW